MSYILDALRKSDQQRQHGAAPTLSSVQFSPPAAGRRKAGLIAFALAVLVAGILIGWWQAVPTLPASPLPVPVPAADPAPLRPLAIEAPAAPPSPAPASREPQHVAQPAPWPETDVAAKAPAPMPVDRPMEPVRNEARPAPVPQKELTSPESRAVAGSQDAKILARVELPPGIQQELPRFSVSLHAYSSKPENRLVSVNDRLLHEGEPLTPGLVLEQIRPDDMVFTYKGFRFRQGIQ